MPEARVVIVNWNGARFLEHCLDDLARQTFRDFAVTVVDNGSTDESRSVAEASPLEVEWIQLEENVGFAAGNNLALRRAREPFVVLLNNDVRFEPSWLGAVLAPLRADERIAGAGGLVLDADGVLVESAGDYVSTAGHVHQNGYGQAPETVVIDRRPTAITAAACAFRRRALEQVGFFDERFFAYYEDVDLCLRLRLAGWELALEPEATVRHAGHGTSRGSARFEAIGVRNLLYLFAGTWPAHLLRRQWPKIAVTIPFDLYELGRRHGWRWLGWVVVQWAMSFSYLREKRRAVGAATRDPRALDGELLRIPLGRRRHWRDRTLDELRAGAAHG